MRIEIHDLKMQAAIRAWVEVTDAVPVFSEEVSGEPPRKIEDSFGECIGVVVGKYFYIRLFKAIDAVEQYLFMANS